ncbi:MAG: FG-GAP repeat domain-containing protein, partial [Planctomycetota bacterium]
RSLCLAGCLVLPLLALAIHPACGQPVLGPGELVQADGAAIDVPGYSVPSFVHWNEDGLRDLVVGEGSGTYTPKVRVYLNVGTGSAPQFSSYFYAQSEGSDLTVPGGGCLGIFPRTVYWDADGRKDLLVGLANGTVKLFLNVGTDDEPTFDGGTFLQVGLPGSKTNIDVGNRATPTVVDWNNDDRKDLVVGAYDGRICLFINQGTDTAPDFRSTLYAQEDGSNLIVPSIRSSPVILDLDGDGNKDLLTGNT